jgi:hypothetical protein
LGVRNVELKELDSRNRPENYWPVFIIVNLKGMKNGRVHTMNPLEF